MGIFTNTGSPLDQHIERATSDKNTSDDWAVILDVCDRVKEYGDGPKDCIKALGKKLTDTNPRVALQAVTLLDACVSNCGRTFLMEVASREFEQELRKLVTSPRTHSKVTEQLRKCLKSWSEGEFKSDRQLSLIPALYAKLQQEGHDFSGTSDPPKKKVEYSTDPNVVNNKQEEDDIAQAIQMSLQSSSSNASSPKNSAATNFGSNSRSLYPSDLSGDLAAGLEGLVLSDTKGGAAATVVGGAEETKKARALYDFEAVEDNELTFHSGELIVVVDSSDPNWWKGTNHRGEGLFPANFVTLDIHGEQDQQPARNEKRVSFSECVKVTELDASGEEGGETVPEEPVSGEVDEEKINLLLHLLHEADPTGIRPDDPQLHYIEERVSAMTPTIDAELEQVDRRHNELSRLNTDLMGGLNLYHELMREMPVTSMGGYYPQSPYQPMIDPATGQMVQAPHHQIPGHYPQMYMMPPGQHPMPGPYPLPMGPHMAGMPPLTPGMGVPPPAVMGGPPVTMGGPPHAAATMGGPPASMCGPPVTMSGPPITMSGPPASMSDGPYTVAISNGSIPYQPPPTTAGPTMHSQDHVSDTGSSMLPSYGHYPEATPYFPPYQQCPPVQQPQYQQPTVTTAPQAFQQPLL